MYPIDTRDETGHQQEPGNELADREGVGAPLPHGDEVEEEEGENALPGKEAVEAVRTGHSQGSS